MRSHLSRECSHHYKLAFYTIEFQLISKYCRHPVLIVYYHSAFLFYDGSLLLCVISKLHQQSPTAKYKVRYGTIKDDQAL